MHAGTTGTSTGSAARSRDADDWVDLGRVARPQGLDGALLVTLHGDDPANLLRAETLTLAGDPGEIAFRVRRSEPTGGGTGGARARVWLEGVSDRERAAAWRGARVLIPARSLPPLPEGDYYWRDLLGLRCRVVDGPVLGVIEEIWPTGSNDVLVVRDGPRRVLIPTTEDVLVRLDAGAGELVVRPPAGLLDEVEEA